MNLAKLSSLEISPNYIPEFPSTISKLSNLTSLTAENNYTANLHDNFGKLSLLKHLNFGRNVLRFLPTLALGKLSNLEVLLLDHNSINSLPSEIENFTKLVRFEINSNYLNELPNELGKLSSFETLSINDNRLQTLPSAA